jgi:multiple sugar transport system permease protein
MANQKSFVFEKDIEKEKSRQRVVRITVQIFLYAFLVVMALIVIFPFYFMLISSVKELEEYRLPVQTLWPNKIVLFNYVEAFKTANLATLFSNTLYVGVISTVLSLVITVITAFAFARLEFKGKNAMFAALLATMMIPGELFTITNYQTVSDFLGLRTLGRELGSQDLIAMGDWKNTFTVLIVPFLVSVFYIYLLRQNFLQIPNELYLAAKVDGTSDLKYLWKVMIPLALPTLISITILKMMGAWNSYMWPRLVANDDAHRLITNGLRNAFQTTSGDVNIPVQMAAVAIVSAPLFLVFIFLRKYIMKGVSRSGIKG